MEQYPHILKFHKDTNTETPFRDGRGFVIAPPKEPVAVEIPCRMEVNDKGRSVVTNDGIIEEFGFIAYMPTGYEAISFEQGLEIFHGELKIGSGRLKRFHAGFFNARAWV